MSQSSTQMTAPRSMPKNWAAMQCPECGAYVVATDNTPCWQCSRNFTTACRRCLQPVSLGGGMCMRCGEATEIVLIPRPSETR
jgi:hypothetical protein